MKYALAFLFAIAVGVLIGFLMAYPVMWMCNYLFAPSALQAVFGVSRMDFWKALELSVLCSLLFKSSSSSSSKD